MANIFPRWSNLLPLKIAVCAGTVAAGVALAFAYYATPKTLNVGYQPSQPIPFSHKIHVDQLGLDCRYCHSFVDVAGHSNVPTGRPAGTATSTSSVTVRNWHRCTSR